MIPFLTNKLQEHPNEVGETYWEHFCHAFLFSTRLFFAASVCLVHAILPFCFKTTGSSEVKRLYSRMVTNRINLSSEDCVNDVVGRDVIPRGLSPETDG